MQSGIIVHDTFIDGTLRHVTDFTGFSSNVEQQSGNFLALKFEHSEGASTTVEILGGTSGPVTLDSDMVWIGRITNTNQRIRVITTLDGVSIQKTFTLNSLELEEEVVG